MSMISMLSRFLERIERLFLLIAATCLIAMLAGNAINIAVRNVTGSGLSFVFPWTTVLFVWMSFFAFFVIYRRGRDISVKFIVEHMGTRGQVFAWLVCQLVALFVMGILLFEGPGILALQVGDVSEFVEIERYWLSVPFFLSCMLVLLDVMVGLLRAALTREVVTYSKTLH